MVREFRMQMFICWTANNFLSKLTVFRSVIINPYWLHSESPRRQTVEHVCEGFPQKDPEKTHLPGMWAAPPYGLGPQTEQKAEKEKVWFKTKWILWRESYHCLSLPSHSPLSKWEALTVVSTVMICLYQGMNSLLALLHELSEKLPVIAENSPRRKLLIIHKYNLWMKISRKS